jgi:hypothetical protein
MRKLACGFAAILALAALVAGSAAAATVPSGGKIALWATTENGPSHKVVFAGAIGDYGTAVNIDRNGKVDENGNFVRIRLQKGSFEIDSTALNAQPNNHPQLASNVTCSVAFSGSAPVKIFNGTGLYKGISGTAMVTISITGVGPRYTSGPNKGQCVPGDTAPPLAMLGSVTGHGTVYFAQ